MDSQAFLEAIYSLYMYFNPAWLTTLTINVGHSAIYSLSFRLLVIWLQEHNFPVPTWNFSPPRCFLLHWSAKASELLTVFSNITHSAVNPIFYCRVKTPPFYTLSFSWTALNWCQKYLCYLSMFLLSILFLFPEDAHMLPMKLSQKVRRPWPLGYSLSVLRAQLMFRSW